MAEEPSATRWHRVLILFGSNLDPEKNSARAGAALARRLRDPRFSSAYQSSAAGCRQAPPFTNWAAVGLTSLGPYEFKFDVLRPIEADLGRVRCADVNAPRTADLDMLAYDDLSLDDRNAGLHLPDPDLMNAAYALVPSAELLPDWIPPGCRTTLAESVAQEGLHSDIKTLGEVITAG